MADGEGQQGLRPEEEEEARQLAAPRSRLVYDVVRRQGEEELARPPSSLFWSGIAGGITIMASVITEGALSRKLPASLPAHQAVVELGYSLGFIMIILGRMQLFTEQTVVAVLPVLAERSWGKVPATAKLWGIVFIANLVGAAAAAVMNVQLHFVSRDLLGGMLDVSSALLGKSPLDILLQGIPAGFLIASAAWIRAGVTNGEFWIVLSLTYAIALGDFTHVIAGSAESFLLLFAGKVSLGHALGGIILPALVGNIAGGTGLFALLAHAQVHREI